MKRAAAIILCLLLLLPLIIEYDGNIGIENPGDTALQSMQADADRGSGGASPTFAQSGSEESANGRSSAAGMRDPPADVPQPEPVENPYALVQAGDVVRFGWYDWIVLEVADGKALLLTVESVERLAYDYYGLFESDNEGATWEDCFLRQWLNGETFYGARFTAQEKALVKETLVINNDNPWFETPGGNDTFDNVFLLSLDEIVHYFGDSGQLNDPLDNRFISDQYNEARIAIQRGGYVTDLFADRGLNYNFWWSRTPGQASYRTVFVDPEGNIDVAGSSRNMRHLGFGDHGAGVRPALWIDNTSMQYEPWEYWFSDASTVAGPFDDELWPECAFTRMVPRPGFIYINEIIPGTGYRPQFVMGDYGFGAEFYCAKYEDFRYYLEQVRASGFTINEAVEDVMYMGINATGNSYSFLAYDENGYSVFLFYHYVDKTIPYISPGNSWFMHIYISAPVDIV